MNLNYQYDVGLGYNSNKNNGIIRYNNHYSKIKEELKNENNKIIYRDRLVPQIIEKEKIIYLDRIIEKEKIVYRDREIEWVPVLGTDIEYQSVDDVTNEIISELKKQQINTKNTKKSENKSYFGFFQNLLFSNNNNTIDVNDDNTLIHNVIEKLINLEFKNENENSCCKICLTNVAQCFLSPCNHAGFCISCANQFQKNPFCPFCRTKIERPLKLFYA